MSLVGFSPTISGDGCRVVFASYAGNLTPNVPGGAAEIYARDRQAAATLLVSITRARDERLNSVASVHHQRDPLWLCEGVAPGVVGRSRLPPLGVEGSVRSPS